MDFFSNDEEFFLISIEYLITEKEEYHESIQRT